MDTKNTEKLVARRAVRQDAAVIMALVQRAMRHYVRNSMISPDQLTALQESKADIEQAIDDNYVLVIEKQKLIVATVRLVFPVSAGAFPSRVQAKLLEDAAGKDLALFSRFAVLPELQTAGIGRFLMQRVEEFLMGEKIGLLMLYTAVANKRLVDFYQGKGFYLVSSDKGRGYERGLFAKKLP